ncbi:hypothetical protein [Piscibacillus salipiscarius]|uniref:Uncharacterized protein n=1 Tax=Piscibacillus salipiscarius TaxID=299480 RepID=A0ABW5Q7Z6_9BACI|nr:hypothetical protein [Piscibacillus salipiscarius]
MGITLILLSLFVLLFLIMIGLPIYSFIKYGKGASPNKWTLFAFSLILLHWTLFLSGFYTLLPYHVTDVIFLPLWIGLSVIGATVALFELRNNMSFAIPLGGLSFISFAFSIFIHGITRM